MSVEINQLRCLFMKPDEVARFSFNPAGVVTAVCHPGFHPGLFRLKPSGLSVRSLNISLNGKKYQTLINDKRAT
jgi:hypothetical protein